MIVDLGETYFSDNFEVRDTNGALANAGTVSATLTLPDQTTTAPTVLNPSTGVYNFTYLTAQAGRHTLLVSATGATLGTFVLRWSDSFDVRDGEPGIVSLADVKAHLNIPATTGTHNEELRRMIGAATGVVEHFCGPVTRTVRTEVVRGGVPEVVLPHDHVTSLTSLTPILSGGGTVTLADLDVDESGIVRHTGGLPISSGPLRAVYVVDRDVIPEALTEAALIIVAHLWETQRGPGRPSLLGQTSTAGGDVTFLPVKGFAIPNRAMDLLKLHSTSAVGIA